ncbi:MAG: polysaccharide deacetylase family protein [Clostridiales bacterium]|jgi:peptidoglycan/xylan/chitin deacetylase (PgdA/CDA1 family)|nr:polysaccharide deacetylase family protein [Clostridiales bacterium]
MYKKILFFLAIILMLVSIPEKTKAEQNVKIPVLLYHHIVPDDYIEIYQDNAFVIKESMFDRQIKYLYDNGYYTITTQQLYDYLANKKSLPPKSIMITFDDGYLSNYLFAYKILKNYNFVATIFIITSEINTNQQLFDANLINHMSWDQIKIMQDMFEFASHTNSLHYTIDNHSALCVLPNNLIDNDIKTSLDKVTNKIAFAYPYGEFNDSVIKTLKNNGIKLGFTTEAGYVTSNTNPFKINRFTIYQNFSINDFIDIVE